MIENLHEIVVAIVLLGLGIAGVALIFQFFSQVGILWTILILLGVYVVWRSWSSSKSS